MVSILLLSFCRSSMMGRAVKADSIVVAATSAGACCWRCFLCAGSGDVTRKGASIYL